MGCCGGDPRVLAGSTGSSTSGATTGPQSAATGHGHIVARRRALLRVDGTPRSGLAFARAPATVAGLARRKFEEFGPMRARRRGGRTPRTVDDGHNRHPLRHPLRTGLGTGAPAGPCARVRSQCTDRRPTRCSPSSGAPWPVSTPLHNLLTTARRSLKLPAGSPTVAQRRRVPPPPPLPLPTFLLLLVPPSSPLHVPPGALPSRPLSPTPPPPPPGHHGSHEELSVHVRVGQRGPPRQAV